jgi:hypothetical protein
MWEMLISSVVRGDYYVVEVNIICCKRDYCVGEVNIICCKRGLLCGRGKYHLL